MAINFQLNDGSGNSDGNNTATVTLFSFAGGAAGDASTVFLSGGASGSIASPSGIIITDNSFFNSFTQGFTAGSTLSFTVSLTTNLDSPATPGQPVTPDQFSFAILENGSELATTDPSGLNALLTANIDSANPSVQSFVLTSAVPEPGSLLLLATGMGTFIGLFRSSRRCSARAHRLKMVR